MKSAKFVALFGALSLVFMGCPYESKFPLDPSEKAVKADKSWEGKWDEKGSTSYTWSCKVEDGVYRITKKDVDSEDGEPTTYVGWLSQVGDAQFLNVYESGVEERTYYFYRYSKKSDDKLKFQAVTDNITEEFTTGEEIKTFFKKYMDLSFFYNEDDEKIFFRGDD